MLENVHKPLNKTVAFYVPHTVYNTPIPAHEAAVRADQTLSDLTRLFGGATAYPARGAYLAASGDVIIEDVTRVESFTTLDQIKANYSRLRSLAAERLQEWEQDAISLEIAGRLVLLRR